MPQDTGVTIIIAGDDQSGAVFQAVEANLARVQARAKETDRAVREVGEHVVPTMSAASASVRLLEGDVTHNLRAVERFLSTTLGLAPVLQAAFPVVGAVAFGSVIFEEAKKLYDLEEAGRHAAETIGNSFSSLNAQSQLANDELEATNDHLRDAIAKLEGKPKNGIKDAIDDAVVEAEKLYLKLVQDDAKISEILAKNHIGSVTLSGQVTTSPVEDSFKEFREQSTSIAFAADQQIEALRKVNDIAGVQRVRDQERLRLLDLQAQKIAEVAAIEKQAEQDRARSIALSAPGTFDANPKNSSYNARIEAARGVITAIEVQSNALREGADNEHLDHTLKQLQGAHDAAHSLSEELRRQNEELRRQQEFLERIGRLGIGNAPAPIYELDSKKRLVQTGEGPNLADIKRRADAEKLYGKSSDDQQDRIGSYEKEEQQARELQEQQRRADEELKRARLAAEREEQESILRTSDIAREAAQRDAAFELSLGRITVQQRIDLSRQALNAEFQERLDSIKTLEGEDASSGNIVKLQRDQDEEKELTLRHDQDLIRIDQQAYAARAEAVRPFLDGVIEPLVSGPKRISDAFREMALNIERSLARIATQRLTDGITGLVLGAPPQAGTGSQPGAASTRGIGSFLSELGIGVFGRSKGPSAGAAGTVATDTAAKLGAGGSGGAPTVTIINQSSQAVGAASTSSSTDQFGNMVLSVILKDADKLGPITSALGGAMKMIPGL